MKIYSILSLIFLLMVGSAQAGLINLKVTSYGTGVPGGNTSVDAAVALLETEINKDFPEVPDTRTYLEGMANGGTIAAKGQGSDYANDVDLFVFGVNMGVGIDGGDAGLSLDAGKVQGFGLNGSILFGMNLGVFDLPQWKWFDPNKVRVFVNLLPPGMVEDNTADMEYKLGHFGVHARYTLIEGNEVAPYGMLNWGGVHVHVGLESTSLKFVTKQDFTQNITLSDGSTSQMRGPVSVGAEVSSFSIPIEISVNAQVGYIFTFYTGLGMDITSSSADLITTASLSGAIDMGQGGNNPTVEATVEEGGEGTGDAVSGRYFAGLQINAPVWKPIYVHLNGGFNGTFGVSAGTKFTW